MFSGGDYEEVRRWLTNFVLSHARREALGTEAIVEAEGPREGKSYGIRLRLGDRVLPPPGAPPLEVSFEETRDQRGAMAWCQALAARVRALARELAQAERGARRTA
jgi:hypothetical protein